MHRCHAQKGSGAGAEVLHLERLTKPFALGEADKRASECGEGEMDVLASFIANGETAEAIEPSQCALYHPAMPFQALTVVHTAAGNPGHNGAPSAFGPAAPMIIGLVGVQFMRPAPGTSPAMPHRLHSIESGCEHQAVVPVSLTQAETERCARPVDHNMALRARFAAIRRVRAGGSAPFWASMDEALSEARLQSSWSASARRSSRMRRRRVHTPAARQSRNRRQHVMPEQPISAGTISQGMPEHRTKRMPASAARSSTRGRPPLGLAGSGEGAAQSPLTEHWEQGVWPCQTNVLTPVLLGALILVAF